MNQKNTKIMTLVFAMLLLLSLAACSTLNPPPVETPTAAASEIPATVAAQEPTALPTQAPYILKGATTTNSGLQFLETKAGDGAAPQKGQVLSLHFSASLPDGTPIADTKSSGEPVELVYLRDQILPGLDEGLALMKADGSAEMVLPSELAFGAEGYGVVPANSQVLMSVELFSIENPPQPTEVASADLTTTESGLQYADLTQGAGAEAVAGNIVITHFTIWQQGEEGLEYVATSEGSEPLTFVQGAGDTVFPGWEEGVLGMQVGGKRQLIVPPELGMGETGGGNIAGNTTLVMEIELTDVLEQPTLSRMPESELTTTESGLQYADLVTGEGAAVESGATVSVQYSGWLENGTLFDSSVTRGEPISFTLGQGNVIQGWDEGLIGMKVGGKRQLIIPAALAYGEEGAGETIPPGATLIFDIELVEIKQP